MTIIRFNTINNYVTFLSVLLSLIIGLYAFVPKVLASFSPIDEKQVERLLKMHSSFVKDGNIEGILSTIHPDFTIDVIHSTGRKERFDKSQILKHQENIKLITSLSIDELSQQISVVNNSQALVSIIMKQDVNVKGLQIGSSDLLYQSMLIAKHNGKLRIIKVLSTSVTK